MSSPKFWRQAVAGFLAAFARDVDVPQLAACRLPAFGEEAHVQALVGAGTVDVAVGIGDDGPSLALEGVGDGTGAVALKEPLTLAGSRRRKFGEGLDRGGESHEQRTLR
ncbi:hypothetical protein [Streptomyces sp. NPDC056937]|uniref:hypothetical protein n=1 Tax=Streptomyces sp. NPDC056937 TaxID=3345969 RepID=UPI00362DC30B